jgi:hypothetical protein
MVIYPCVERRPLISTSPQKVRSAGGALNGPESAAMALPEKAATDGPSPENRDKLPDRESPPREHSHRHSHFDGTVHEHPHAHGGWDPDHEHDHNTDDAAS